MLPVPPRHRDHRGSLDFEIDLSRTILAALGHDGGRIVTLVEDDPDLVAEHLLAPPPAAPKEPIVVGLVGGKREVATNILMALRNSSPAQPAIVALPKGAP